MHVGNKHEDYKNIELCIDGWTVKTLESFDSGEQEWEDTLEDDMNKFLTLIQKDI